MSAARHDSAGTRALAEAARLEAALVYGRVIHEHKNTPAGLSALIAEAELTSRGCGEPGDKSVDGAERNVGENKGGPEGAANTSRGLTHSLELGEEGLAMQPTQEHSQDGRA